MKPTPITFRIYPQSKRSFFYEVFILPDRLSMHRFFESNGNGRRHKRNWAAITTSHEKYRVGGGASKSIGEIYFYSQKIGAGLVSHEMLHASIFWHRRKYKTPTLKLTDDFSGLAHGQEEELCYVLGNLVAQFYDKVYSLGIIEPGPVKGSVK